MVNANSRTLCCVLCITHFITKRYSISLCKMYSCLKLKHFRFCLANKIVHTSRTSVNIVKERRFFLDMGMYTAVWLTLTFSVNENLKKVVTDFKKKIYIYTIKLFLLSIHIPNKIVYVIIKVAQNLSKSTIKGFTSCVRIV